MYREIFILNIILYFQDNKIGLIIYTYLHEMRNNQITSFGMCNLLNHLSRKLTFKISKQNLLIFTLLITNFLNKQTATEINKESNNGTNY